MRRLLAIAATVVAALGSACTDVMHLPIEPSQLVLTVEPSSTAQSGVVFSQQPVVELRDAVGNSVSKNGVSITASISSGGGSLGGTATVQTNASGLAVFTNLTITGLIGNRTLQFIASNLTPATSNTIAVTAGIESQLSIVTQPSATATSGAVLAQQPTIQLGDAAGNNVSRSRVVITASVSFGGGTLGGMSLATTNASGLASFTDLAITGTLGVRTLNFTAGTLTAATSNTINVNTAGSETQLFIVTQPSATATSGAAFAEQPAMQLRDVSGNGVNKAGVVITASIATGGGTLSGATTATTKANGLASFTNLSITGNLGNRTLSFISGTLTAATSNTIDVNTAGTETQLFITTQPSATATSGAAFAQQPAIQLRDTGGNNVSNSGVVITASIATGGGTLGGAITATTSASGLASFTNLSISGTSGNRTLSFSSGTLTGIASNSITVAGGDSFEPDDDAVHATSLITGVSSPNHSIEPATDQDWFRFTVSAPSAIQLETSGPSGDTKLFLLDASQTQIDEDDDLGGGAFSLITRTCGANELSAGTYYARVESFNQASTIPTYGIRVDITGCPTGQFLSVSTQPSTVATGVVIAPAVQITVRDAQGNTVTSSVASITLAITSGTGTAGSVLGGTLTRAAVSGVATFTDLTVNLSGIGYTLTATSSGLTSAVSAAFNVTPTATLSIVKFLGDNQTALIGYPTNIRPAVRITNAGNPVGNVAVTFAVLGGGGSVVGNAITSTNANGVAQVGNWVVGAAAGANTLMATGAGSYLSSNNVTFAATSQTAQFDIDVRNIGLAFSPAVQAAFNAAVAHWQNIIYGDQPDIPINTNNACLLGVTINQTVDDIIILAQFDSIDGPGKILGSAGACSFRISNGLTIYGAMLFDTADVAGLIASGDLNAVILHEMGHVLGFSTTTWNTQAGITQQRLCAQALSSGSPPNVIHNDTHFDCTQSGALNKAKAAFDSLGGLSYTGGAKVPLENCAGIPNCGPGQYNSHWRDGTFGNELMTGYLNSGGQNPLSLLTIASFEDQGYLVNYAAADAYSHVFFARLATPSVRLDLGNDRLNVAIEVVNEHGRVVDVIPPQP